MCLHTGSDIGIMLINAFQPQAPGLSYPTVAPNYNKTNFFHWHPERAQQQKQPRTILPQHVHFYNALSFLYVHFYNDLFQKKPTLECL